MGQIRGNIYFLKPDQRVWSFIGGRSERVLARLAQDQRECILPEARSEGTKLHRGRSKGVYTSCSQIRGNKGSYGADQSKYILLEARSE
jgi:hypothetical protein